MIEAEMESLNQMHATIASLKRVLGSYSKDFLAAQATELSEHTRECVRAQFLLEGRQLKLAAQMQNIYPITTFEKDDKVEYRIAGLHLPHVDLSSTTNNEEMVSTALGYASHLVIMLSKYFQVALKYTIIHNGSRSYIRDNITTLSTYPLYRKGNEREKFDKGVQLLQQNTEQLLISRDVGQPKSRSILGNLHHLFKTDIQWMNENDW